MKSLFPLNLYVNAVRQDGLPSNNFTTYSNMNAIGRTGWIGVDVGTSTVKVAQLERSKNGLRLAGLAIVSRRTAWPVTNLAENEPLSSADEMRAAVRGLGV